MRFKIQLVLVNCGGWFQFISLLERMRQELVVYYILAGKNDKATSISTFAFIFSSLEFQLLGFLSSLDF